MTESVTLRVTLGVTLFDHRLWQKGLPRRLTMVDRFDRSSRLPGVFRIDFSTSRFWSSSPEAYRESPHLMSSAPPGSITGWWGSSAYLVEHVGSSPALDASSERGRDPETPRKGLAMLGYRAVTYRFPVALQPHPQEVGTAPTSTTLCLIPLPRNMPDITEHPAQTSRLSESVPQERAPVLSQTSTCFHSCWKIHGKIAQNNIQCLKMSR